MRAITFCGCLITGLALMLPAAKAGVTVTINQQQYQFSGNPRLTEVLAPVALQQSWYWPAAALYQLNEPAPEQMRQDVLQQLAGLQTAYADDNAMLTTLVAISQQVQSWQLAKRVMRNIDYDAASIDPARNPRFDDGNYLLHLTPRPKQLYLFGALSNAGGITHQSATELAGYRSAINYLAAAAQHQIFLLQPDGNQQQAGVVSWNHVHVEPMPGSQLFVPIAAPLFDQQITALNQALLALAVHRVLP